MSASPLTRAGGDIVIVGDVMLDRYLMGSVDRISPEAPVPVLRHMHSMDVAGGAANVAMNVAALGAPVRLFGVVGEDAPAGELARILGEGGVDGSDLLAVAERPTTTKTRVVAGRQQIVRFDAERSDALADEAGRALAAAVEAALPGASILVISDYCKGVLTDAVLAALFAAAKRHGVYVVVDPKRARLADYAPADLIKPNRAELAKATGLPADDDAQIDAALTALRQSLPGTLLITRAEHGMSLAEAGRPIRHFPVVTKHGVADVSGAGDTSLSALVVALNEGHDLETATLWAILASGIAVSKPGTAIVDRVELDEALVEAAAGPVHSGALVERDIAARAVKRWQDGGDSVVFTNGCFDIVHPGHIALLEAAAKEGQRLVVGLNTDASVSRLKGPSRPVQTEANRARVIGALRFVDLVVLFDEETPLELVTAIQPDVIVKGADYREDQVVGGDVVKARGGRVALVNLVEGQSSTRLINRMAGAA